ncbi:hypothetical protein, partial [Nitrosomonas nitrosa]
MQKFELLAFIMAITSIILWRWSKLIVCMSFPNSAIEFLISPADVPKHDRKSESGQKAVDLM